jgi:hypothetical protein
MKALLGSGTSGNHRIDPLLLQNSLTVNRLKGLDLISHFAGFTSPVPRFSLASLRRSSVVLF